MEVLFNKNIQKVPVKIWSPIQDVESGALDQLKNIAGLPFVFKHVAAMADVHHGKGATVGSVIATKGAVLPAAVGVDIGCGMMAMKLDLSAEILQEKASTIRSKIEETIPLGPTKNSKLTKSAEKWSGWETWKNLNATNDHTKGADGLFGTARLQLGSLGGGNHFIELCIDTENNPWIMLHSGSRNIGKSLAEMHIYNAKEEMKKMFISLPDPDLAYYVEHTEGYRKYMHDLMWAQDYAAANREEMMGRVLSILRDVTGGPFKTSMHVNCHHNYASYENHYGENVIVTRKGAVRARAGDLGIIPGSMGTRSYIVRGLGNPESFMSCSHGAGRRLSRSAAKRHFTLEDLINQTAGVDCKKDESVLDEIPGAYKDIDQVMENQKDLVETVAILKQFMCVKG